MRGRAPLIVIGALPLRVWNWIAGGKNSGRLNESWCS
jgi:hypothetical protein